MSETQEFPPKKENKIFTSYLFGVNFAIVEKIFLSLNAQHREYIKRNRATERLWTPQKLASINTNGANVMLLSYLEESRAF